MKLKKKNKKDLHGQGVLEYVLVVGIVVVALMAMTQMIKRGHQSLVRSAAAQLGAQVNADQSFGNTSGYLDSQNMLSYDDSQKQVVERVGIINYVRDSQTNTFANSLTNMGFTEEN